jgi:hypothetical protein
MTHRASSILASAALLLALVVPVGAMPPDRIPFTVDDVFQSGLLTRVCGTPIWVHVQGTGTIFLFYDNGGQLVREIDVMPGGLTWTYSAPTTGKTFTQTVHTPTTYLFPEGVFEGAPALAIYHGVQHTSGAGSPRIVGREAREAFVDGISAEGVPLVSVGDTIWQAGQFDVGPVVAARCALLIDP